MFKHIFVVDVKQILCENTKMMVVPGTAESCFRILFQRNFFVYMSRADTAQYRLPWWLETQYWFVKNQHKIIFLGRSSPVNQDMLNNREFFPCVAPAWKEKLYKWGYTGITHTRNKLPILGSPHVFAAL